MYEKFKEIQRQVEFNHYLIAKGHLLKKSNFNKISKIIIQINPPIDWCNSLLVSMTNYSNASVYYNTAFYATLYIYREGRLFVFHIRLTLYRMQIVCKLPFVPDLLPSSHKMYKSICEWYNYIPLNTLVNTGRGERMIIKIFLHSFTLFNNLYSTPSILQLVDLINNSISYIIYIYNN